MIAIDFSIQVYKKILSQPLIYFKNKKSSEIINSVIRQCDRTQNFIKNVIQFISTSLLILAIIVTLLFFNWQITIIAFLLFSSIYLLLTLTIRKKLIRLQS